MIFATLFIFAFFGLFTAYVIHDDNKKDPE